MAAGRNAARVAAFGAATGLLVHITLAACGLAVLLQATPMAYRGIRIAGGIYLLILAIGQWRTRGALPIAASNPVARSAVFRRSLLNNLANPKVILFFVAFLPQFIPADSSHPHLTFVVLGLVFLLLGLMIDVALAAGSGWVGDFLRRRQLGSAINRAAAAVYGALGLRLLVANDR
jgi:threonine/homoserine/homoserine lactone efflux protein